MPCYDDDEDDDASDDMDAELDRPPPKHSKREAKEAPRTASAPPTSPSGLRDAPSLPNERSGPAESAPPLSREEVAKVISKIQNAKRPVQVLAGARSIDLRFGNGDPLRRGSKGQVRAEFYREDGSFAVGADMTFFVGLRMVAKVLDAVAVGETC